MDSPRQHPTLAHRALWLGLVAALIAGGCWQEIHYTGPDRSTVARSRPSPEVENQPPTEASDATVEAAAPDASLPPDDGFPLAEDEAVSEITSPSPEETESIAIDEPDAHENLESPDTGDDLFDDADDEAPVAELETTDELLAETPVKPAVETPAAPEPHQPDPPDPALATRLAAWQLGSKLTLAAVANDRGLVPEDADRWFAESRAAAEKLGTSVADLPTPSTAKERAAGSRRMHDYLFQQGQRIFGDLSDRFGEDHAALFEAAVKSNVLIVLYGPSSTSVEPLASSIRDAAPKARLPIELLQPLLDTLARQAPVAEVRAAVRTMHADVERHLREQAEQD